VVVLVDAALMTTTSGKLMAEARTFGWEHQGVLANYGKVHKDFFAKGSILIVATYSAGGHISTARRSTPIGEECLGSRDGDKVNRVISWFQDQSK
jgi:hypothetical protein